VALGNANGNIGGASSTNYDARYNNSIRYDSPSFNGLTIATHYAFIGENSSGTKAKGWDTKVDYNNGPLVAAIAYSRHIDFTQYDGSAWIGHLAYDFGVVKLEGQYQLMKYDGNNGSVGDGQARYWHAGVVIPLGPGWLTAQYHNRDKGVTTSATAITEVKEGGGKAYSMSYRYGFSKRTYVYGFGAQVKADQCAAIESIVPTYNAATQSCAARPAGSAGKATAFGFGVQHNF
jgi:predicted porin